LGLQSDVALAIGGALGLQVTVHDRARLVTGARAVNPTAYDLYLRGLALQERVNTQDAETAVDVLEQAVELDPNFADALGALASAYVSLYGSYRPEDASRLEPKARTAMSKALLLDPDSADAIAGQGNLLWDAAHGWPHEEAIQLHRKALALKPNLDRSHVRLATIYNHVGLAELALRELGQSNDSPAVLMQKGLAFRIQGKDDLALASWLAIPPSARNTNHLGHIAWSLAYTGKAGDAWTVLRQIPPSTPDVNGMLSAAEALLHAMESRRQQAEQQLAVATAQAVAARESHHATYIVAVAYAKLGNRDESLRWLRFTSTNGFPCYPLFARDINLESLRSYPPFVQFLDEAKTRWDGYRVRLGG
jgi:tetratricopeptide (TPR) repeat protein